MSSKYECFNCLGECNGEIGIKNYDDDSLFFFCSTPCMKVSMRDKTEEYLDFIHTIANNAKYLKYPDKHDKFLMKVSQAIKDHVSERMLILYFEKLLESMKEEFGTGHLLVENGTIKEERYIKFGDFVMSFKDTYKFLASVWSND